jgi:hypothetical protein
MKTLALLAVCGIAMLTQGAPATQPLPLALMQEQQDNWTESLFILERTITIPAGTFDAENGLVVWTTTRRHTDTNAVETTSNLGTYTYYFDPEEDIVIFDRRANVPIWYGIAVLATGVAMVVFFLIVKNARKPSSTQSGEWSSSQGVN